MPRWRRRRTDTRTNARLAAVVWRDRRHPPPGPPGGLDGPRPGHGGHALQCSPAARRPARAGWWRPAGTLAGMGRTSRAAQAPKRLPPAQALDAQVARLATAQRTPCPTSARASGCLLAPFLRALGLTVDQQPSMSSGTTRSRLRRLLVVQPRRRPGRPCCACAACRY